MTKILKTFLVACLIVPMTIVMVACFGGDKDQETHDNKIKYARNHIVRTWTNHDDSKIGLQSSNHDEGSGNKCVGCKTLVFNKNGTFMYTVGTGASATVENLYWRIILV